MVKLTAHWAAATTASAAARMRLGNISPSSTHTTGPQLTPKNTLAAMKAIGPSAPAGAHCRRGRERQHHAGAPQAAWACAGLCRRWRSASPRRSSRRDYRHRDDEGVGLAEADRMSLVGRIVEDHVDADELLEYRQQDAHHSMSSSPKRGPPKSRRLGAVSRCRLTWIASTLSSINAPLRPPSTSRKPHRRAAARPWRPNGAATPVPTPPAPRRRWPAPDRRGHPAPRFQAQPQLGSRTARSIGKKDIVSSATKISITIASCCKEPSRPRTWAAQGV